MEKIDNISEIINGCLRQNRKSQEQLFKLYYGKMLAVSMRYTNDNDTSQEIVQTSFIKVFDKLSSFDNKGSFEGWIKRIVINTAIDFIRKSKKDPFLSENDYDFKDEIIHPMEEKEQLEILDIKAEIILEAMQKLSPAYRTVFNLYVLEDFSHKEIAEKLGISEGSSKSNLSKARANIQKLIESKLIKL